MIDTYQTGAVDEEKIEKAVRAVFDMTPAGIIKTLKLRRPIFRKTAAYGHFGRSGEGFTWEKLDKVAALKRVVK